MNSATVSAFILYVSDLVEGVSRNSLKDGRSRMQELANTYSCIAHFVEVSGIQDFSSYKKEDFLLLRGMTLELAEMLVDFLNGTVDLSLLEAKSVPQVSIGESQNTLLCTYLKYHLEYHSSRKTKAKGVMCSLFYTRIRAIRNCGFTITSVGALNQVIMKSCIIENLFLNFLRTEFGYTSPTNNPLLIQKSVKAIKASTKEEESEQAFCCQIPSSIMNGTYVLPFNPAQTSGKTTQEKSTTFSLDTETGEFGWDELDDEGKTIHTSEQILTSTSRALDAGYVLPYDSSEEDKESDVEGPCFELPGSEGESVQQTAIQKESLAIASELISQHIECRNQDLHEAYRKDLHKKNTLQSIEGFVNYLEEKVKCATYVSHSYGVVYVTIPDRQLELGKIVETLQGVYTLTRVKVADNFKVLVYII